MNKRRKSDEPEVRSASSNYCRYCGTSIGPGYMCDTCKKWRNNIDTGKEYIKVLDIRYPVSSHYGPIPSLD